MSLPTTRVLAVLEHLQGAPRLSGAELARRVEVDVRTLRRYIVALETIGVPITTERGRHGGYSLVAGYKLPPMMFTDDETLALSLGLIAARGLGLAEASPAVESTQAKLARVMPDRLKDQVRAIVGTIRIAQRAPNALTDQAVLSALCRAAQDHRRVRLDYRAGDGTITSRDVDPYGLAWREGAWYAVGHCHLRAALRSFRVDRVAALAASDVPFARPEGFDALGQLTASIARLPRPFDVEVLLDTDLETARSALPVTFGLFEPVDGGVLLRSGAEDLGWFARQLARLPFDFTVRKPTALRREVVKLARRLERLAQARR